MLQGASQLVDVQPDGPLRNQLVPLLDTPYVLLEVPICRPLDHYEHLVVLYKTLDVLSDVLVVELLH